MLHQILTAEFDLSTWDNRLQTCILMYVPVDASIIHTILYVITEVRLNILQKTAITFHSLKYNWAEPRSVFRFSFSWMYKIDQNSFKLIQQDCYLSAVHVFPLLWQAGHISEKNEQTYSNIFKNYACKEM